MKWLTQGGSKEMEKTFHANGNNQGNAEEVILMCNKTDFQTEETKAITRDKKGQQCNTIGIDPTRRHNSCKHPCTQCRSTYIYGENFGGLEGRDQQEHSHSWGL